MRFQPRKFYPVALSLFLLFLLSLPFVERLAPASQRPLPTVASLPTSLPLVSEAEDQTAPDISEVASLEGNQLTANLDHSVDSDTLSVSHPDMPETQSLMPSDERRVMLAFAPNTTAEQQTAYLSQLNAEVVETIPALNVVIISRADTTTLPASSLVVASEPDYYAHSLLTVPTSDPFYNDQWALDATGIPQAWLKLPSDALEISIAVIDSGICADHPDLVGRVLAGYDFVERDAIPQDEYGHGCAVGGIIAAHIDNAVGMAGVAPNARLLPLRVLDSRGYGRYSDITAAIVRAADSGAQIINLSLGGPNPSSVLENAVKYARSKGVQVVAAAGNTGQAGVYYPAAYSDVIAVGAVDANLIQASYSSYGAEIDTLAPGTDILAPTLDGGYGKFTGTSMAAPHVSGLLALKLALGETLTFNGAVVHSGYVEQAVVSAAPQAPAQPIVPQPEAAALAAGDILLVSQDVNGNPSDNVSHESEISADGRYVVFPSDASDLVNGDTGNSDIFVRDMVAGITSRVSVSSSGTAGNGNSNSSVISGDGRYIVYASSASNLGANDTNTVDDIFLYDVQSQQTIRVSVSSGGDQANALSRHPTISGDGRYIAFTSDATSLTAGDTNTYSDVFIYDRTTQQTQLVSKKSDDTESNGVSYFPELSDDGRFVAFFSGGNLTSDDVNIKTDAYVLDRQQNTLIRASAGLDSAGLNGSLSRIDISGNGRYVLFEITENNLLWMYVYLYDRYANRLERLAASASANQQTRMGSISADGRLIVFSTDQSLAAGDTGEMDVYLFDRQTQQYYWLSQGSGGTPSNGMSYIPHISSAGAFAAFSSQATNLVAGDTNAATDVFRVELPALPATNGYAAPSLTVQMPAMNQVVLNWTDNAWMATSISLERSTDGTNWSQLTTVPLGQQTYTDALTCEQTYYYRVRGVNSVTSEASPYSSVVNGISPCAPSEIKVVGISPTQIQVTWRDNATNESEYRIERSTSLPGTYTEVGVVGANSTSFIDTFATCNSRDEYYYRVRAYNVSTNTYSGYTSILNSRTPPCRLNVTTTQDLPDANPGDGICAAANGMCSLRAAITEANLYITPEPGTGMDIFVPAGVYAITIAGANENQNVSGDFDVTRWMQIYGAGMGQTIIDGNGLDRIFEMYNWGATLTDMTIRNGRVTNANGGGIRLNISGGTTLYRVELTGNAAVNGDGGGIYNYDSELTIYDSLITSNTAVNGGGISGIFAFPASIIRSTVQNNTASGAGGGLHLYAATLINSTIANNQATDGGGIYVDDALASPPPHTLQMSFSTVSGNIAQRHGGGLFVSQSIAANHTAFETVNTTITDNTANAGGSGWGGGIYVDAGNQALFLNTILYGNRDNRAANEQPAPECSGPGSLKSSGNNLFGDMTGCFLNSLITSPFAAPDIYGQNPQLGALQDQGWLTRSHRPAAGSPVFNTGSLSPVLACNLWILPSIAIDQGGQPLKLGDLCGIGSYTKNQSALSVAQVGAVMTISSYKDFKDIVISDGERLNDNVSQLSIAFNAPMAYHKQHSTSEYVESRDHYRLLAPGANGTFQTNSCTLAGDDQVLQLYDLRYIPDIMSLTIETSPALSDGQYRLIVCGTLKDARGQALDGDKNGSPGGDYVLNFSIQVRPMIGALVSPTGDWLTATTPYYGEDLTNFVIAFQNHQVRMYDPTGSSNANDVTNSANYRLIRPGANGTFQTATCVTSPAGDDTFVTILNKTYPLPITGTIGILLVYSNTTGLAEGQYRFIACPTLQDELYRRGLDGNGDGTLGDPYIQDFSVVHPPTAPSALTITGTTSSSISLGWQDNSSDETGFVLERSPWGANDWTTVGAVSANTTTFTDTSATCDLQPYQYRVKAFDAVNRIYSVASTAVKGTLQCPLSEPTNFVVSNVTTTSITLSWLDNATEETHYLIRITPALSSITTTIEVPANTTTYTHSNLIPSTSFNYRIAVHNANTQQTSAYSSIITGTTLADTAQPSDVITVTTPLDENNNLCGIAHCSLREAVTAANANANVTTIILQPDQNYELRTSTATAPYGSSALTVTNPLILEGNGSTLWRNPAAIAFRVMLINNTHATLRQVTIENGQASAVSSSHLYGERGGGLLAINGAANPVVLLEEVIFRNNNAREMGAALYNEVTLTVDKSLFIANGQTIITNAAANSIIYNAKAMTMTNSTISGNGGASGATGLFTYWQGTAGQSTVLHHNTFANNRVDGVSLFTLVGTATPAQLTLMGNVFADNITTNSRYAICGNNALSMTSTGYNIADDNSCRTFLTHATDQHNTDALLTPLADNGGDTLTHAVSAGSPALNLVPAIECVVTADQRRMTRPIDNRCEAGAYEDHTPSVLVAPSFMRATNTTRTQVDLAWIDNTTDETSFALERSTDGVNWILLTDTLPADTTNYSDTSLTCETTYAYRVRSFRSSDNVTSAYSNVVQTTTMTCDLPQTGDTLVVNTTLDNDDGLCGVLRCSLREAVNMANATAGTQTITLPAGTYVLTRLGHQVDKDSGTYGGLQLTDSVIIAGAGAANTIIRWTSPVTQLEGIFHIPAATANVTIQDVTVTGLTSPARLAAIENYGTLTLTRVIVSNNNPAPRKGAGIYNAKTLVVTDSILTNNTLPSSGDGGAAIYNEIAATLTVERTLVSDNQGIAIRNAGSGAIATIRNSTFTGNRSTWGAALRNSGTMTLEYVTITNNMAAVGGGSADQSAVYASTTISVKHSIIANNLNVNSNQVKDCYGTLQLIGANLIQTSCTFTGATASLITGVPANLLPLADNGGFTMTYALQANSPALNAALAAACTVTVDQRGQARPQGANCDLGAFESATIFAPNNLVANSSETTINLTWSDPNTDEISYRIERSLDGQTWGEIANLGVNIVAYTDPNLTCFTPYYYRLRAENGSGQFSVYTASVTATTACTPLVQPADLMLAVISPTNLRLTWNDLSTSETGYQVERSTDGTNWGLLTTLPADSEQYDDLTAVCDVTYYYRLTQLRSQDNATLTSSSVSGMTQFCAPPAAPTLLTATLQNNVIDLLWQDNATNESAYTVERSTDAGVNWITLTSSQPANATTYQDAAVTCSGTYTYRVRAERSADTAVSAYSNTTSITLPGCPPQIPLAPMVQDVQRTSVTLALGALQPFGATQIQIERSTGVSGSSIMALDLVWQLVGTLPVDAASFTDTNLICETSYQYRTRLYRPSDNTYSDYSPVTTIITLPCPVPVTNTVGLYQAGVWLFRDANDSGLPSVRFVFGPQEPGWTAIVGDWDGDGEDGIGLYKNGMFALRNVSAAGFNDLAFQFGDYQTGWLPLVGDWNGDDVVTVGIYKDGLFLLRDSNSAGAADYRLQFDVRGLPGAVPIVGDWDGNGADEIGLYRAGYWYLPTSLTMPVLGRPFVFGPTDGTWQPVSGDWNADGISTIGVYKAGIWRLRNTNSEGVVDLGFMFNEAVAGWQPLASYRGGAEALALLSVSPSTVITLTEPVPPVAEPTIVPTAEAILPEATVEPISTVEAIATEVIPTSTTTPEATVPDNPVLAEATAEATEAQP